jgi:hypothetical protein
VKKLHSTAKIEEAERSPQDLRADSTCRDEGVWRYPSSYTGMLHLEDTSWSDMYLQARFVTAFASRLSRGGERTGLRPEVKKLHSTAKIEEAERSPQDLRADSTCRDEVHRRDGLGWWCRFSELAGFILEGGIRGKVTVQGGAKGVGRCCWRALQELLESTATT